MISSLVPDKVVTEKDSRTATSMASSKQRQIRKPNWLIEKEKSSSSVTVNVVSEPAQTNTQIGSNQPSPSPTPNSTPVKLGMSLAGKPCKNILSDFY